MLSEEISLSIKPSRNFSVVALAEWDWHNISPTELI